MYYHGSNCQLALSLSYKKVTVSLLPLHATADMFNTALENREHISKEKITLDSLSLKVFRSSVLTTN